MSTTGKSTGLSGAERRVLARYHLAKHVDIVVAKGDEMYWGTLKDLISKGLTASLVL